MADSLHWMIGDVTITRVVESVAHLPAVGLLPSASDDVVATHASRLRPHFVHDDGKLILSIHAFGIAAGDRRIVVDTCIGNDRQIPGMEPLNLQTPFLSRLADAGFAREDVDRLLQHVQERKSTKPCGAPSAGAVAGVRGANLAAGRLLGYFYDPDANIWSVLARP